MDTETEEELTIENNGPPGCRGFPENEHEEDIESWLLNSHRVEPTAEQHEIIQSWIAERARVIRNFRESLPDTANFQYELAVAFGGPWGRRKAMDEPKLHGSRYGFNSLGQKNAKEQEAIALMEKYRDLRFTYKAIAVIVSDRGFRNRGGNRFSADQVSRILKHNKKESNSG